MPERSVYQEGMIDGCVDQPNWCEKGEKIPKIDSVDRLTSRPDSLVG